MTACCRYAKPTEIEIQNFKYMKKITITCDVCQKVLDDEYIRLGSENEQELCFENKLPNRKVGETISIARYRDLHFCCKEHFVKYFFERE